MYPLIRTVLFFFDPERVHYFAMRWLQRISSIAPGRWLLRRLYSVPARPVHFCGLTFTNVVGLGAGFDKNALYLRELALLGFGHVEIGTVTPRPQPGNDKPRLFRLPEDKALINRMGFNNDGADAIAQRLQAWRQKNTQATLIIGGNIGKQKTTPNEEAYLDYDICYRKLYPWVDYFVVNVSSPNTPGLRELQEKESLRKILVHLQEIRAAEAVSKPLLLKIAPDLTDGQLEDVVALAREINLDGLVVSNTTLDRSLLSDAGKIRSSEAGAGGLSGAPVRQMATGMVQKVHTLTQGNLPVIGVGGIFSAQDAQEKLKAGATLIQIWTGFIYEGPAIVKKMMKGLPK
ncbi:MAG: quinone-dependent dihydroorotate dehydrogenase [Chitinophagaceae bacterium]|nr:quinone-dependent dihydroorotate dehydrogenase [Chitinophagaceae bacterium]